jgi:hypothetical protein
VSRLSGSLFTYLITGIWSGVMNRLSGVLHDAFLGPSGTEVSGQVELSFLWGCCALLLDVV